MLISKTQICRAISTERKILKSAAVPNIGKAHHSCNLANFECIEDTSGNLVSCDHVPEVDQEGFKPSFQSICGQPHVTGSQRIQPFEKGEKVRHLSIGDFNLPGKKMS